MTSIARINKNDQNLMYRTLDRGVQGIVVPNVQTKAEAENVVQGCYYQPIGMRGVFTSRQGSGVADFHDVVNAEVLTVVLLENVPALDANLDEILTVEHIDVFMVTTGDLAQSMGLLSDRANPKVIAKQARPPPSPPLSFCPVRWRRYSLRERCACCVQDEYLRKIIAAGKTAGAIAIHPGDVAHLKELGVQLLWTSIGAWLEKSAAEYLAAAKL